MRVLFTFIPGSLGAALIWHTVANCLPFKEMSPSLGGLATGALLVGIAATFAASMLAFVKPHAALPLVSAALGLGLPFLIVATRLSSLDAASGPSEAPDFSWRACSLALNHGALQAAGLVFLLAGATSLIWRARASSIATVAGA